MTLHDSCDSRFSVLYKVLRKNYIVCETYNKNRIKINYGCVTVYKCHLSIKFIINSLNPKHTLTHSLSLSLFIENLISLGIKNKLELLYIHNHTLNTM